MSNLTVPLLQHIPKLTWERNYDQFKNKEKITKSMFKTILIIYFKLLFKFLVDTGRHIKLPGILGYVGMFKFKPKKDLIVDYNIWAKTGEKILVRNNLSGPYKPKIKWYKMGNSSKVELRKITPDYIYKFNRRNFRWYCSEVMKNSDKLTLYPVIENSRIKNT